MPQARSPEDRPLTAALYLGDRSPYGLSVARALLVSSLSVRHVIVPSESAYARAAERAARRTARPRGAGIVRGVIDALSRQAGFNEIPPDLAAAGEPIRPPALDPGTTLDQLEMACASRGIVWQRVDAIGRIGVPSLEGKPFDLLLCAAFPLIFGRFLLAAPAIGCVNFHPSLLPRCRGCHPIFWTLASGETQGGVTAHFMTDEVDAGGIIAQIPIPLTEEDDYGSLYERAMKASPDLVRLVEQFFESGRRQGLPQDPARATVFHEDTEEDHRVRWSGRSPQEIAALARTGEAFTLVRGERLGLLEAIELRPAHRERRLTRPGTVISVNDGMMAVSAAGGAVGILSMSWRGRRYRADELAHGLSLKRGTVLA